MKSRRVVIRSPRRRGRAASGAHLVLSFERQPEDELTIHRHDGVEVETDVAVDRGHVAPSALQWMAVLQAAAAGGIENQVYRRLSLIRDKRLGTPTEKPNCHRRFAIVPNLEFCGVDRVLRHQPAGVDARRRLPTRFWIVWKSAIFLPPSTTAP